MIRTLLLFLLLTATAACTAQIVVQIDAGSRAPWGRIQVLTIDATGKCAYSKYDVSTGAVKDSSSFTISQNQLNAFLKKAETTGFFELKESYIAGIDGAGILIALKSGDKKHSVNIKNTDVPQVNEVMESLNAILQLKGIRINCGQPK